MTELYASFWEHLAVLRRTLLLSFFVILIGMFLSFFFYEYIFSFLTQPLKNPQKIEQYSIKKERLINPTEDVLKYTLPHQAFLLDHPNQKSIFIPPNGALDLEYAIPSQTLILLSPFEGFVLSFKLSFWVGLLLTSPLWLWMLLRFFLPALRPEERAVLPGFLGFSFFAVLIGLFFGYTVMIPLANDYFFSFNRALGENLWSVKSYLDYTITLLLGNAIIFELGAVLLFAVHLGLLSRNFLMSKRRHAIITAFILGAFLTPPDILTQFLMAIPLIGIYELTILYAKLRNSNVN